LTTKNSTDGSRWSATAARAEADDNTMPEFEYGHGRMPFFMKLVWLAFLGFGTWYTVVFLLDALGTELGAG